MFVQLINYLIFEGNQYDSSQKKQLNSFFSIFYVTLNLGSTIGTILTPILRTNFKCFGNDCYPLAFGIPNIMMLVGILVFVLGTPFYKSEQIKKENVITKTIGCVFYAVKNKIKNLSSGNKKEHWLDYAEDKYSGQLIYDIKIFLKVCFVFVPIPI